MFRDKFRRHRKVKTCLKALNMIRERFAEIFKMSIDLHPRSVERTFHPEPDTLPYVRRLRERYGRWCEACSRFSQWHPEEEDI